MVEVFIPHIYDNRKFQAIGDSAKFTLSETDLPPQICDSLPMTQGEWLSSRLRALGKKKIDFGAALGVPPPRVTDIINGKRILKGAEISKAADFLECSPEELVSALYGYVSEENKKPIAVKDSLENQSINKSSHTFKAATVWNVASYLAPKLGFPLEQDRKDFADLFVSLCDYLEEPSSSESGSIAAIGNVVDFAFRRMRRSAS